MKTISIRCEKKIDQKKIIIHSDQYDSIEYIFPFEEVPAVNFQDFAIWAFLPIAMTQGVDLHLHGTISQRTLDSATKISRIWAQWVAGFYNPVTITADNISSSYQIGSRKLTFFSGGVDSTYSAYKSYLENGKNSDSLTIHGMDYKFDDDSRFIDLFEQTKQFRSEVFNQSRVIKTNIYTIYNKIGCNPKGTHVTHIFSLFSCGSLFDEYNIYQIAADYRLDQQYIVHPYGSNSATNRLMFNTNGQLSTLDDDVTRSEKVEFLANSTLDLTTLSICVDYNSRPKNCGKCSKCVRTKAMFYASNGKLPPIFLDDSFEEDWYEKISLSAKINRAFVLDILTMVEERKQESIFPGYYKVKRKVEEEIKESTLNPFLGMKKKDVLKLLFVSLIR